MAATDDFSTLSAGLDAPARNAVAITPSDSVDLTHVTRGIYVGGAGNIVATMQGTAADVTFVGVAAGSILPVCVTRVKSTSTTATSLVALW